MAPFAASLLPAGLGLFWGAATALYRRFAPAGVRAGAVLRRPVLPAGMAARPCADRLSRGTRRAPAGRAGSAASQFASVVGVYGLSFVTVAAVCGLRAAGRRRAAQGARRCGRRRASALWRPWSSAAPCGWRGAQLRADTDTVVRIVQADVQQESQMDAGGLSRHRRSLRRPDRRAPARPTPDVIVWPEGALPASGQRRLRPELAGRPGHRPRGAARPDPADGPGARRGRIPTAEGARYYNSLFALADEGGAGLRVTAVYDKYRLVPFGEFLPLGGLMGAHRRAQPGAYAGRLQRRARARRRSTCPTRRGSSR